MNDEQLEILTEIFRTLFNNPELNLDDELVATDVPGWDSFNHINLVINVEEEFEVKFTNDEVAKMQNVGDLKKILAIKISA
jgi:acyl carrier protein